MVFLENSLFKSDLGGKKIAPLLHVQRRSPRSIETINSCLAHTCIRPHIRKN